MPRPSARKNSESAVEAQARRVGRPVSPPAFADALNGASLSGSSRVDAGSSPPQPASHSDASNPPAPTAPSFSTPRLETIDIAAPSPRGGQDAIRATRSPRRKTRDRDEEVVDRPHGGHELLEV